MELGAIEALIKDAGGGGNAQAYARALQEKVNRIETHASLSGILDQFRAAKEAGDFRGRVFEINFAHSFLAQGIVLSHAVKQGQTGDIDFCWDTSDGRLFFELKLLGEQLAIKKSEKAQAESSGVFAHAVDDRVDVGRLQRDIFAKSSVTKFDPTPEAGDFNLLVIDASELQLGMVDECDCVHAVCGATGARPLFDDAMIRSEIVGALEIERELTREEEDWVKRFHLPPTSSPHPRTYIHGVVFLFRAPKERAALAYELSSCVVWNCTLMDANTANRLQSHIYKVLPKLSKS